ncbi:MAG: NosD domain-containing protein [Bacteroidota bacterium]|nr:NosD domain-containing protein [Bacteroidota bacterium]
METSFKPVISVISLLMLITLFLSDYQVFAQGRMVRGIEKVEYELKGTAADFYVSPSGDDNWTGKLAEPNKDRTDGPFATIERAKTAVKKLKDEVYQLKKPAIDKRFIGTPHQFGVGRDILVLIRDGVYSLDNTLEFSATDGGERVETDLPTGAFEYHELKDYYVIYAAYPGETPVISGGERITGWKKLNGGKWMASLNRTEVDDLYANGKRLTLARTPNSGYFLTDGQPNDAKFFKYRAGDLKSWKGMETNRIHMTVRWGGIHTSIARIDEKKHMAWLTDPSTELLIVPPKYYVENIEALMDTVGEWYFNKNEQTISFIPDQEIGDPNLASVEVPKLDKLIDVSGTREKPVRNLRFYNLKFENTRSGGGATLSFQYSKNCELLKNRIENVGQTAIRFGPGCYHNLISRNVINDVKGSGINVSGNPKPENWNDVVSDNVISFNKVTNTLIAATGISTSNAIRTTVSHNYISNTGSYGITLGSWPNIEETSDGSHLAEYNHVSFTNMKRDDEGGIAVYGLSPGSVVRNNLIHDVHPAATNENVGFFFQNMSLGWKVTDNIYYNLKQGELKYCAAYPVDNVYQDNFSIETPANVPEEIINGSVDLGCSNLQVKADRFTTGSNVSVSATVNNTGSTGIADVYLYVDGKVADVQKFPVISNNARKMEFSYTFFDPGKHTMAIGQTAANEVLISGDPLFIICHDLKTILSEIPLGDSLFVSVEAQNARSDQKSQKIELLVDGKVAVVKEINFKGNESKQVQFAYLAESGSHSVTIGNLQPINIKVYPAKKIDLSRSSFLSYCSATANPCSFEYDIRKNHYEISAAGTDFLHAEDSYGTIYLNGAIEGNFVATVKVIGFSEGISEWFRAGIFTRNDLSKSNQSKEGNLGSVLMLTTTKRNGVQWDEFGNGCMHNAKSKNYGVDNPFPVWLKLVRHGDRFSGYYCFDGKTWILSRESGEIPGLAKKMDIGLAGGSNDQKVSKVFFEDFQLWVEDK